MAESEKNYRWDHAADWLAWKVQGEPAPAQLRGIIRALMGKLPEDDIQDIFQSEMEADGFFDEVTR